MSKNFEIFSKAVYTTASEVLAEKIALFNQATNNAIALKFGKNEGSFTEEAIFAAMGNMVRKRNPTEKDGSAGSVELGHAIERSVKIAAGTKEIILPNSLMTWIGRSPIEASIAVGQQLSVQVMADMINTSVTATVTALGTQSKVVKDYTGESKKRISYARMAETASLMGDSSDEIVCWLMHSVPRANLLESALANTENLFKFGTVSVSTDVNGRPIIVSDIEALKSSDVYNVLGLRQNAILIEDNNDWVENIITANGKENLRTSYQAEWSYQLSIAGISCKTTAGTAPNDAALAQASNWEQWCSSHKDLAGVLMKVKAAD